MCFRQIIEFLELFKVNHLDIVLTKFWPAAAGWQYSGFDFKFPNIGKMFKGNKWKLIFQSYTRIQMGGTESAPPGQTQHLNMPVKIGLSSWLSAMRPSSILRHFYKQLKIEHIFCQLWIPKQFPGVPLKHPFKAKPRLTKSRKSPLWSP